MEERITDMKKDTSNLDEITYVVEECDLEVVECASDGEEGTLYVDDCASDANQSTLPCKKAHLKLIRTFLMPRRAHVTWSWPWAPFTLMTLTPRMTLKPTMAPLRQRRTSLTRSRTM